MIESWGLLAMLTGCAALLGLAIGSFLNVVIWRVPRDESVVRPASACPACGAAISPRDNIPVLSWMLLRGTARCCGVAISRRYPAVEAVTALAWAGVTAACLSGLLPQQGLPALLYFVSITIALTLIDIDVKRLPNQIVLPSYLVAGILLTAGSAWAEDLWAPVVRMAIGAAAGWGFYFLLVMIYPRGMGFGDVKLAGVLGGYLGWLGWSELVVGLGAGFFFGGVLSIALLATGLVTRKTMIPYGPFMFLGSWFAIFVGAPLADWYLRISGLS